MRPSSRSRSRRMSSACGNPRYRENLGHRTHDRLRRPEPSGFEIALDDDPTDRVAAHVWNARGRRPDALSHKITEDERRPIPKTAAGVEGGGDLLECRIELRADDVRVPRACRIGAAHLDGEDLGQTLVDHPLGQVE